MGGGPVSTTSPQRPMPFKETCPPSSDPKTKPTTNIDEITYPKKYYYILLFTFAAAIIILLVVRIRPFDVSTDPKFEIHSISVVYPFDDGYWATSCNYLDIRLTSINPDKDRAIICDNLVLSVFREKELFLVGILPPFRQEPGEETLVEETVGVSSSRSVDNCGGGNYSVKIDGRIKYAPGTLWERNATVTVRFDDVRVEFPPLVDAWAEYSGPTDSEVETTGTEELQGEEERWVHWVEQVVGGLLLFGLWLTPYLCFSFVTRLLWPLICSFRICILK